MCNYTPSACCRPAICLFNYSETLVLGTIICLPLSRSVPCARNFRVLRGLFPLSWKLHEQEGPMLLPGLETANASSVQSRYRASFDPSEMCVMRHAASPPRSALPDGTARCDWYAVDSKGLAAAPSHTSNTPIKVPPNRRSYSSRQ